MKEIDLSYNGVRIRLPYAVPGCFYTTYLFGEYDSLHVKPGDIVLDAGANIGDFTVLAARRAGKSGRVVAIEPNVYSRELLAHNLAKNGLHNVDIVNAFVSGSDGFVDLADVGSYSERYAGNGSAHRRVSKQTIDGILESLGVSKPNILKMDIEGEEADALQGQHFLSNLRELCVEVHGREKEDAVTSTLVSEGFKLRLVDWKLMLGHLAQSGPIGISKLLEAEMKTHGYLTRFAATALVHSHSGPGSALRSHKVYYGTRF
jgi:FkbM family methyltransferase